jgi:hypothetical protein
MVGSFDQALAGQPSLDDLGDLSALFLSCISMWGRRPPLARPLAVLHAMSCGPRRASDDASKRRAKMKEHDDSGCWQAVGFPRPYRHASMIRRHRPRRREAAGLLTTPV